jgi:hypothetical protein
MLGSHSHVEDGIFFKVGCEDGGEARLLTKLKVFGRRWYGDAEPQESRWKPTIMGMHQLNLKRPKGRVVPATPLRLQAAYTGWDS